jgi:hypothetical protein
MKRLEDIQKGLKQFNMTATNVKIADGELVLRYHETDVVRVAPLYEGVLITLDNGGYQTAATKRRINQLFESLSGNVSYHLVQRDHVWYIQGTLNGETLETVFLNGMTILAF